MSPIVYSGNLLEKLQVKFTENIDLSETLNLNNLNLKNLKLKITAVKNPIENCDTLCYFKISLISLVIIIFLALLLRIFYIYRYGNIVIDKILPDNMLDRELNVERNKTALYFFKVLEPILKIVVWRPKLVISRIWNGVLPSRTKGNNNNFRNTTSINDQKQNFRRALLKKARQPTLENALKSFGHRVEIIEKIYNPYKIPGQEVKTYWLVPKIYKNNYNLTIFNFHAGGFVLGSPLDIQLDFIVQLAEKFKAKIILIDYAKAPKYTFSEKQGKSGFRDSVLVTKQIIFDEKLGSKYDKPYALFGDSAGGALVLEVAMKFAMWQSEENRDSLPIPPPSYLFSFYPPLDSIVTEYESTTKCNWPTFNIKQCHEMVACYGTRANDKVIKFMKYGDHSGLILLDEKRRKRAQAKSFLPEDAFYQVNDPAIRHSIQNENKHIKDLKNKLKQGLKNQDFSSKSFRSLLTLKKCLDNKYFHLSAATDEEMMALICYVENGIFLAVGEYDILRDHSTSMMQRWIQIHGEEPENESVDQNNNKLDPKKSWPYLKEVTINPHHVKTKGLCDSMRFENSWNKKVELNIIIGGYHGLVGEYCQKERTQVVKTMDDMIDAMIEFMK